METKNYAVYSYRIEVGSKTLLEKYGKKTDRNLTSVLNEAVSLLTEKENLRALYNSDYSKLVGQPPKIVLMYEIASLQKELSKKISELVYVVGGEDIK